MIWRLSSCHGSNSRRHQQQVAAQISTSIKRPRLVLGKEETDWLKKNDSW